MKRVVTFFVVLALFVIVVVPGTSTFAIGVDAETFDISGVVVDEDMNPIPFASVWLENGNQTRIPVITREIETNEDGEFVLSDIPVSSPRYMVSAEADGFYKSTQGRIGVDSDSLTFVLTEKSPEKYYKEETLRIVGGYIISEKVSSPPEELPEYAILDSESFPSDVLPYLVEGEGYEITDTVKEIGDEILDGIPTDDQDNLMKRARAVYDWVVSNIEYDLVSIYRDDLTCGNYQTTYGGFGIDFDDWCYTPEEVIENGRAICIEFERLTTALLRYLDVPARSTPLKAHPVTQFWVQENADSDGYWANMETSKGRTEWKKGNLDAGFPSREDSKVAIIPQDENAPIHMKWDFGAECLWLEDYGGSFLLEGTWEENQEEWTKQLDNFSIIGSLPKQGNVGSRPADAHMNGSDGGVSSIYYRGFEVELANATETHPVVKFPYFVENEWRVQHQKSHYVSIPGIVEDVWVESEENDESGLTQKWYCIKLDLTKIAPQESDDLENVLKNPGFEDGEIGWSPRRVGRETDGKELEIVESPRSGKNSAKITNESDGVSIWAQIVTDIESPAFVKLCGYIKSESSKGRAFIDLNCLGGEKENKPPYPATEPAVMGTSDWTYVEGIFEVTEGSDAIAIGCTLLGTGTVWFDDISLTVIDGETKSTSVIEEWVTNPSSGTDLCVHIIKPTSDKPESGYPTVLVVPGGNGFGTQMEDTRLISEIVKSGVIVVVFDPEGRGKTGGEENYSGLIHQDGMHEVLSYVSDLPFVDPDNLGVLSMSFGLIMSACTLGRYPNDPPVKFFIDKEGPDGSLCDYSGKHGQSLPKDEDFWDTREAYLEIENYPGNYLRIQNEKDHVQKTNDHALRMINHATSTEYGGEGSCNFTRVNFAEGEFSNPANTTYTEENPPVWIDNMSIGRGEVDSLVVDFILEMIEM